MIPVRCSAWAGGTDPVKCAFLAVLLETPVLGRRELRDVGVHAVVHDDVVLLEPLPLRHRLPHARRHLPHQHGVAEGGPVRRRLETRRQPVLPPQQRLGVRVCLEQQTLAHVAGGEGGPRVGEGRQRLVHEGLVPLLACQQLHILLHVCVRISDAA